MAFERFNLLSGAVEVHYPDKMDAEDVRDFEETMALIMRGVKRRNAGSREDGFFNSLTPEQQKAALVEEPPCGV